MNNASLGLSIQKYICDYFNIEIPVEAQEQFNSSYTTEYDFTDEVKKAFLELQLKPIKCLTYTRSPNARRNNQSK